MNRLKRYWKAIFAGGGALAAWLLTTNLDVFDGLDPKWKTAITGAAALVAVLRSPANEPKPPAEPQPPAKWPLETAE